MQFCAKVQASLPSPLPFPSPSAPPSLLELVAAMGGKSSTPKSKSGGTAAGARAQVSQADLAILELKIQRDKLTQHKKKVEATMARDREIAGQLVREGKRDKALLALRRRKMHAKLIEKTDDQIFNMEHMINTVETPTPLRRQPRTAMPCPAVPCMLTCNLNGLLPV